MTRTESKDPVKKDEPAPAAVEHADPLASLRQQMDRLFDDFSKQWPGGLPGSRAWNLPSALTGWVDATPAVDIVDLGKEIQVRVELPGMDGKDIEVEVSGDMLTIRGETRTDGEEGEKGSRYYLSERRYGSFERTLRLPEDAECGKPDARFDRGVLSVTFPKQKQARKAPKKIKIES